MGCDCSAFVAWIFPRFLSHGKAEGNPKAPAKNEAQYGRSDEEAPACQQKQADKTRGRRRLLVLSGKTALL